MHLKILRDIREALLSELSAARIIPTAQKPLGVGAAGDKTFPVDRIAEDIVISGFESSGLPFTVVSEEYGIRELNGGGKKVLIDPIDGSKNAISGLPFYCTSIAIAGGDTIGSIETGYVINLINGDEFLAERGRGAFLNNEPISAQKGDELFILAYEAQSPGRDIPAILPLLSASRRTRCLGATALDLSYLAYGSISVFITPAPSRSFDFGAGWLLVKEAGGIITDLSGNSLEGIKIGLEKSTPILASGNAGLHRKALDILNSASA